MTDFPFDPLSSPASLAVADTLGSTRPWKPARHLLHINNVLVDVCVHLSEGKPGRRVMLNVPPSHGKSWLASVYFPAWFLCTRPEHRIMLVSYDAEFAEGFGMKVRDVVARAERENLADVSLRPDAQKKGEWLTRQGGGMVCVGARGGAAGRHPELLLIDDILKNAEEAYSPTILQKHVEFYESVVYGRTQRSEVSTVMIGTRWSTKDLFGHALRRASNSPRPWQVIKYKAVAEDDDPLGRAPGEALWPENVPLENLQESMQSRWWRPNWQQEPLDEEGAYFHPASWPRYQDVGDAYSVTSPGAARVLVPKSHCIVTVSVDWAYSQKSASDFSAIGAWALTPARKMLLLEVVNRRLRLDQLAPEIALVCRRHSPSVLTVEVNHPTLHRDLAEQPGLPPVRWVSPKSRTKLQRALPAILMSEQGDLCLPEPSPPWLSDYANQLADFDGSDGPEVHDDMVDMTAWACEHAQQLKHRPAPSWAQGPFYVCGGREEWW